MRIPRFIKIFFCSLTALSLSAVTNQISAQQVLPADDMVISVDDVDGVFTTLENGPVLTETSPGQINLGFIEFQAPLGFEWDITGNDPSVTVELAPAFNGSTSLEIEFVERTTSTIRFEVTETSDNPPRRGGEATFNDLRIRPATGSNLGTFNVTASGAAIAVGSTSFGRIDKVAGDDFRIRVETAPDGSGTIVPEQELTAGDDLTVYSVIRDQFNNFKSNGEANWDLLGLSGGIAQDALQPATDNQSAVFSSEITGNANIRASSGALETVTSETIIVLPDEPVELALSVEPSSTATAGEPFAQQPVLEILDQYGNVVNDGTNRTVNATRNNGIGDLQGAVQINSDDGVFAYSDLSHNIANQIDLRFSASGLPDVISGPVTIEPNVADSLVFVTQPSNHIPEDPIDPPIEVQVTDAFGNSVPESGRSIELAVSEGSGVITAESTNPVDTNSDGLAVFSNIAIVQADTYRLTASNTGLNDSAPSESFIIAEEGEFVGFAVESTDGNDISVQVAGEEFTIQLRAVDALGNTILTFLGEVELGTSGTFSNDTETTVGPFLLGEASADIALIQSGPASITAINVDGDESGTSNSFLVQPADADSEESIFTVAPDSIIADGNSESILTVQLADRFGNELTSGGDNVNIIKTEGPGTLSGVSDNGDGTYTAIATAPDEVGTAVFQAEVNSETITENSEPVSLDLVYTFGPLHTFLVQSEGDNEIEDQVAGVPFSIRITALDSYDNVVTSFEGDNATVEISTAGTLVSGGGTTEEFTDGVLSSHEILYSSSGQFFITARRTGFAEQGISNEFIVSPGPADATTSTITPGRSYLQSDGSDNTTITVQLTDEFGNLQEAGGDGVTLSATTDGSLSGVTDQGDGTYMATLTAGTTPETVVVTGTVNGTTIDDNAVVTITQVNTWTSTGGGPPDQRRDWNNNQNWTTGIPEQGQIVVIPTLPEDNLAFPRISDPVPDIDFLVIEEDATVNLESGNTLTILEDIDGEGTLIADNAELNINGDILIRNITAGTSVINLTGLSGQFIGENTNFVGSIINLQSDVISDGYLEAASNLTIPNGINLSMQSGSELVINDQFNIEGSLIGNNSYFRFGGNINSNEADIVLTDTDIEFSGNDIQQITGFSPVQNLIINNPTEVLYNNDLVVNGELSLLDGMLTIQSGFNLVANNKTGNLEGLRMLREIQDAGEDNIDRRWRMLSSPIASTIESFLDGTLTQGFPGATLEDNAGDPLQPNVLYYEESHQGTDNQRWRAPSNASNDVQPGRGYFVYVFGDIPEDDRYNDPLPHTLDVQGGEFDGNGSEVALPVTYTAEADTGWNLVGNPFAATIDWDDGTWRKQNMNNSIYVWDPETNQYRTWNGVTGSLGTGKIAPFQAFWVKANGEGTPDLRVRKNSKTTGGTFYHKAPSSTQNNLDAIAANHSTKASQNNGEIPTLGFRLNGLNMSHSTHFSFTDDGKNNVDDLDAFRLLPFDTDSYLQIYSLMKDDTQLSINNLPRKFGRKIEIPVHAEGIENGEYIHETVHLSWPEMNRVPDEWKLLLYDRHTNTEVNLREETHYSFTLHSGDSGGSPQINRPDNFTLIDKISGQRTDARFLLQIDPGEDAGELPSELMLDQNFPNPFNPSTKIRFGLPVESLVRVDIYDILGRKVQTLTNKRFRAGFHEVLWDARSLASGVYIYRLQSSEGVIDKKMTLVK